MTVTKLFESARRQPHYPQLQSLRRSPTAPGCTLPLSLGQSLMQAQAQVICRPPPARRSSSSLIPGVRPQRGGTPNRTVQRVLQLCLYRRMGRWTLKVVQKHSKTMLGKRALGHPLVARTSSSRKPLLEISDSKRSSSSPKPPPSS